MNDSTMMHIIKDTPSSSSNTPFTMPSDNPLFSGNNDTNQSHNSYTQPQTNNVQSHHNNAQLQQPQQTSSLMGMEFLANKTKIHQDANMTDTVNAHNTPLEPLNEPEDTFTNLDHNEPTHTFDISDDDSTDSIVVNEENRIFDETNEDVIAEKRKLLFKIYCMERKGVTLTKKFSMMNSFEELKNEYDRVAHEHNVTSSIRFSRKMLMMSVTAMEYLNNKFDPFDINLDGWSESVHENVTDYDDVFGELYEKYHTKAQIAPEVKLMLMLGGSGFMFHLTNSMFKQSQPASMIQQFAGVQNAMDQQKRPSMAPPIGVDDILSELKQSRDLDSMSDDSQSVMSNASDDNKFIKIKQKKRRRKVSNKSSGEGNFVHLDL